jgi:hypothetical protein
VLAPPQPDTSAFRPMINGFDTDGVVSMAVGVAAVVVVVGVVVVVALIVGVVGLAVVTGVDGAVRAGVEAVGAATTGEALVVGRTVRTGATLRFLVLAGWATLARCDARAGGQTRTIRWPRRTRTVGRGQTVV